MRITSQSPLYARPGVDAIVQLYEANRKIFYPRYTKSRSTMNSFDRIGTEGTFPALSAVGEGTTIPDIDYRTPWTMDVTPVKYGGKFVVSSEASETDKMGIISRKVPKLLSAADLITEQLCADIHNLATSASLPTPDGVSFANASHLYNGGTFSNIVTGTPALSQSALELALAELHGVQKDDEGNPMGFNGPYKLLVPYSLVGLANRLVLAQKLPTTNNNDPNWAGEQISEVVVNPYFTSQTAWSLIASGNKNPFVLLNRRGVKVESDKEFDKDGMKWKITKIFTRYAEDPRGFIYSGS